MVREMVTAPAVVAADARNRAWRTWVAGLAVDVATAVVVAVGPMLLGSDFAFTRPYWVLVGTLAARTAVQTGVAYLARYLIRSGPDSIMQRVRDVSARSMVR